MSLQTHNGGNRCIAKGKKMIDGKGIDKNLKPFRKTLLEVKKFSLSNLDDIQIKAMSRDLKVRAIDGEASKDLMPEAFAIVFEAVKRTMAITPFDVQLIAAAALASGRIIEFPTGEGKTLTAVFVAYLEALSGRGVHVLTFNDYLAKRDALWMKPIYDFLEVSVRFINENMDSQERKAAYDADVTYVTAKESGFDYLKNFLAYNLDSIAQRAFHFAIIDEADSILIDEARIPLVLAGDIPSLVEIDKKILATVSRLEKNVHFETDEYADNIYLTESGIAFVENDLGLDNLFKGKDIDVLAKVNVTLQAEFLLKKDIDYIVKNDEILLVDEFTGRVMKNRQWPDGLHAAVELKEGLTPKTRGIVMNTITLQNFLKLYPTICGMTGTACSAGPEFHEFYNKAVSVIPPNRPCRRVDHPDVVFTHKDAKFAAIAEEIKRVHAAGRPILVGTSNIEESEYLANMLRNDIKDISVLNAKHDEEEAGIIANAGMLSAVTISTNMAGRGVDIHLGGKEAADHEKVCSLGGLYVIGTNRYESVRIDNQLRGRAGRQGDPGESRFFISLEDNLIVKFRINDIIPEEYKNIQTSDPLQNSAINKAIVHTQRIIEGQIFDSKLTLAKYSYLVDDQRKIVHNKRESILRDITTLSVLEKTNPARYRELLDQVSEKEFKRAQKEIELFAMNKCWADHLLYVESALDGVQIVSMAKSDPFLNYNQKLIEGFADLEQHIHSVILEIYETLIIKNGHIDLNEMGVKGPSSTRTYLVHDGTELQSSMSEIAVSAVAAPMYTLFMVVNRFRRREKKK